ncbi:MAG: hypothetical protein CMC76_12115 [Flavobacteriaceae bacterium]|nr:hypothetical protein [Flavobacteriaceae bacterium]|tara:strand:+ start:5621 stop:6436 length:816 start_codon:yes stop_codon:yes gene_type:complete
MKLTELFKNYDNYLELNYTSKDTISNYKSCFKKFVSSNSRIYRMSANDIETYFVNFSRKYSVSYYNQMLSSVRIIFKLLEQPQKLKNIPYKEDSKKEINILSVDEIKNSLLLIDNIKHRCIINLLYVGALRISELQNITLEDIDSENNRILIQNGKGGKSRRFPITDRDLKELRIYYKKYRPETYLFESTVKGKKYSQSSIRNVVKKIRTNKHVYPHLLRHTALTNLMDNKHNIMKVQQFAGHKSPKSTQRYYHLSKESLSDMVLTLKDIG